MTITQSYKPKPIQMSPHKLALNVLHHYYVTAVNKEGSALTLLSADKESNTSFFRYMAIVENNINNLVNQGKPWNERRLQVLLDKDNLEKLLYPNPVYIRSKDGVVTLSSEINAKYIKQTNSYLGTVKGLLNLALDKSYEDLIALRRK